MFEFKLTLYTSCQYYNPSFMDSYGEVGLSSVDDVMDIIMEYLEDVPIEFYKPSKNYTIEINYTSDKNGNYIESGECSSQVKINIWYVDGFTGAEEQLSYKDIM